MGRAGEHGADAFRWYYLASQQPWAGYRFSAETRSSEGMRELLLPLWTTYGFYVLYANIESFDETRIGAPPLAERPALDRWAISRLQELTEQMRERIDAFDATTAVRLAAEWVEDLSNWYIRLSRRRFWNGDLAALATLRECLVDDREAARSGGPVRGRGDLRQPGRGRRRGLRRRARVGAPVRLPRAGRGENDGQLDADMALVREAIELGRDARARSKVKVRQPLRRAIVCGDDARGRGRAPCELVLSELNVKAVEIVADVAELVRYAVKPNYRSLGPRFGKSMPTVAAAVEALNPGHVAEAIRGERQIGINVDGAEHTLTADDMTLVMQPLDGYEVEAESGRAVALALELDDELIREGLAREIVHAIQNARKQAGLDVSDRISLVVGGDDELVAAARAHDRYIAGETLATSLAFGGDDLAATATIEGRKLLIAIDRA